jgi:hypothetical protein
VVLGQQRLDPLALNTWFRADLDPGVYAVTCIGRENRDTAMVRIAADEISFVEIGLRIGLTNPRCGVVELTPEKGRAEVLAGHRAAEIPVARAATSASSPVQLIFRDDISNERRLQGTIRYEGILGSDRMVRYIVQNLDAQPVCTGTLINEGPNNGRFSLSCFDGRLSANGSYERKTGDANGNLIARGETSHELRENGRPSSRLAGTQRPTNSSRRWFSTLCPSVETRV